MEVFIIRFLLQLKLELDRNIGAPAIDGASEPSFSLSSPISMGWLGCCYIFAIGVVKIANWVTCGKKIG